MFIIFDKTTKQIYSRGAGTPEESEGKLQLNGRIICNDLSVCGWKYIADQRLEQDENGYVHDADYYDEISPEPTEEDRLAALEQYIAEKEMES